MNSFLEQHLRKREEEGIHRTLSTSEKLVDFASNDYLGLARSSALSRAISEECRKQKELLHGSTGSRLLTGNSAYTEKLEAIIARFHGFESSLLYTCGYMANFGLLTAIAGKEDVIFYDLQVHASTHDGLRATKARLVPFRHNDMDDLERRLKNIGGSKNRFLCVESVDSTDGSIAPLREITRLAHNYNAALIVDEAHAVGVIGAEGRGLVAEYGQQKDVFAQIVTFGKALGVHGAAVLGSNLLKRYLINFSRPFIYTTALPFHAQASIKASYQLFPHLHEERKHIQCLATLFSNTPVPIQPYYSKGSLSVRKTSALLKEKGIDVRALVSPTVKKGSERLRITLHAYNTVEEACRLKELLP